MFRERIRRIHALVGYSLILKWLCVSFFVVKILFCDDRIHFWYKAYKFVSDFMHFCFWKCICVCLYELVYRMDKWIERTSVISRIKKIYSLFDVKMCFISYIFYAYLISSFLLFFVFFVLQNENDSLKENNFYYFQNVSYDETIFFFSNFRPLKFNIKYQKYTHTRTCY